MKKELLRILTLLILLGVIIFFLKIISPKNPSLQPASNKILITASFYPHFYFAQKIGGEKVEVINLTPLGIEPHDYEPKPSDIQKIYSSKIFLFNGSNFDPWAANIAPELLKKKITVLEMSQYIDLIKTDSQTDPHFWLDPINAQKEIEFVRDALIGIDPLNKEYYKTQSTEYFGRLSVLEKKYSGVLTNCQKRAIIVSHNAFNYLGKRYGIEIISLSGISPDEEPSSRKIAEIVQIAKEKNMKYIFFETLVSPKLAETVATEIGVKILSLNPIEGLTAEDLKNGKDYFSLMEENLNNLSLALSCQ